MPEDTLKRDLLKEVEVAKYIGQLEMELRIANNNVVLKEELLGLSMKDNHRLRKQVQNLKTEIKKEQKFSNHAFQNLAVGTQKKIK